MTQEESNPHESRQVFSKQSDTLRVLVADDDQGLREGLEATLLDQGHQVRTARNGSEALALLGEEPFDLVLSDIIMPDRDGIGLLREIREHFPQTLVVMITAYASMDSVITAVREGAYDYLTKPFRTEELYVVVKNAADRVRLLRENRMLIEELKRSWERLGAQGSAEGARESEKGLQRLNALQRQLLRVYAPRESIYPE